MFFEPGQPAEQLFGGGTTPFTVSVERHTTSIIFIVHTISI
jgi:hypothetical protein